MGLADILGGINLKDIAMGLAVASNGNTAVSEVLNIMEKQRLEQEKKDQARNTSNFIQAIYGSQGNDQTPQILAKQRGLNAMPDTVKTQDFTNFGVDQTTGEYNTGSEMSSPPTIEEPNLAKAKASIDFVQELNKARDTLPNVADAIAKIWPQFQDKNLDPQLVSSAFAHLYGVNEKKVEKLMGIMDKQQAREDVIKTKKETITFHPSDQTGYDWQGKVVVSGTPKDESTNESKNAILLEKFRTQYGETDPRYLNLKAAMGKKIAPDVKSFQVGGQEIPHQWDEASNMWRPIQGMGGPKWNPKETAATYDYIGTDSEGKPQFVNKRNPSDIVTGDKKIEAKPSSAKPKRTVVGTMKPGQANTNTPTGAILVPGAKTKTGGAVYKLPDGKFWTP
jgi:hypothetical protein